MAKHLLLPRRLRWIVRDSTVFAWISWSLEAAAMALVWGLCWLLPTDTASGLGRAVLRRLGPRLRNKSAHIRRNLRFVVPERSAEEIEVLMREIWGSFGAMVAEMPHFGRIAAVKARRVEVFAKGDLRSRLQPGQPVVFVSAHTASVDIATLAARHLGIPLTVPYWRDSNPLVARMIRRFRRPLEYRQIPRDQGLRTMLAELRAGRGVGLAPDNRTESGEPLPFFGAPTPTTLVPAKLALRTGSPLVAAMVERLEGARFRVTLFEPLEPDDRDARFDEQARQMTRKMNALFAAWIRERPEQWLMTSRRWPKHVDPPPAPAAAAAASRPLAKAEAR